MNEKLQRMLKKAKVYDNRVDVSYLDEELLKEGHLIVRDASFYESIPQEHLSIWCHQKGIYGLPTTELIQWLKQHVTDKTIEIGSGNGCLGRTLGIPITDSCVMENPVVRMLYIMSGQPVTEYPSDIIRMEGTEAVKHYKPDVVIGCWVTQIFKEEDGQDQDASQFGFDEEFILDNVKKYIVVGNSKVHGRKRILKRKHEELTFPWLFSRSHNTDSNLIYIWEQ